MAYTMLYELLLRPKLGSIMPYKCATDNILVGLIFNDHIWHCFLYPQSGTPMLQMCCILYLNNFGVFHSVIILMLLY